MKTILYPAIALFSVLTAFASCSKDEKETSPANTITVDGVEKNIGHVRYNVFNFTSGERGGFRLSTSSSRETFDPDKDFDLYFELKTAYMSMQGTKANRARRITLRSNGETCTTDSGAQISDGSIIVKMGSSDQAEIRINMVVKYKKTPEAADTYHRINCIFKGKMQHAESFGGI